MCEANIESHDLWANYKIYPGELPEWKKAMVHRATAMVQCEKNHPSIIFWSMGNETGWGTNFDAMYDSMKTIDPTRPIHYQSVNPAYAEVSSRYDIQSTMYPDPDDETGLGVSLNEWVRKDSTRPLIVCEYAHAMGNSTGNFWKFWKTIESNRTMQGGFIWDWVDQALYKTTDDGRKYLAYGGDFGDVPNDGNFCSNGLIFADRTIQPGLLEVKKIQQNITVEPVDIENGIFILKNKYYFIPLDFLELLWDIREEGEIIQSGRITTLDVSPQNTIKLSLPYKKPVLHEDMEYDLDLSFKMKQDAKWAPVGYELAWEQFKLPWYKQAVKTNTTNSSDSLKLEEQEDSFIVKGSGFMATFNKSRGMFSGYVRNGKNLLISGSFPEFWRAPTDNDLGGSSEGDPEKINFAQRWKNAGIDSLKYTVLEVSAKKDNSGKVVILSKTEKSSATGKIISKFIYSINHEGIIHTDIQVNLEGEFPPLPKMGSSLYLPKEFEKIEWFGRGPHESYWDRKMGARFGRYQSTAHNEYVSYIRPQENGNHADTKWIIVRNDHGEGWKIQSDSLINFSIRYYSLENLTHAKHSVDIHESDTITLNLDYQLMGLGGDDSWNPRVHKEFRLTGKNYQWSYTLIPL